MASRDPEPRQGTTGDSAASPPTADLSVPADKHSKAVGMPLQKRDGSREGPGSKIGPYELLQLIGEGGFGSVFMAQQTHPMQRKVALKIIKLGMDTQQVVARFEQERQALAILDHPSIAKVFDAGATETGRPYFVMELCTGDPIDVYCDRQHLTIPDRLALFAQVCEAVQHAHTKGIIHRDLKPGNVLVSAHGGRPLAKVIDFGIAKATVGRLTEQAVFTEHQQIIGTPEYMSPEQAEGSLDIDTRTDVYALGVMLYELLTGSTPFSARELRSAAYAEIQRIIREVEPPKPSTRLSQSVDTIASVAAKRQTEPRRLGTLIRGELDWIVMKALEKDRTRRYESASGLMADVQRYIRGEAVLAAPPSNAYRFRKFVRRNRGAVSAAAAIAGALTLGVLAFGWQARVAGAERDRAIKAEREAMARAEDLQKVSKFQAEMLQGINATRAGERLMKDIRDRYATSLAKQELSEAQRSARVDTFAKELSQVNATDAAVGMIDFTILKPAISAVDAQFKDQPAVDASLRLTLAELYKNLGQSGEAIPLGERAAEIRRRVLGADHPDTIVAIDTLGTVLWEQGEPAKAEAAFREAVETSHRVLGADDPTALRAMGNLGNLLRSQGKFDEAEPLLRASLEGRRRVLGEKHRETLIAMNTYGFLFIEQGKLAEGERYWRDAYEIGKRESGTDDPDVVVWTQNLGGLMTSMGRHADAEPFYREVVESSRRIHGLEHPTTLTCMTGYANTLGALTRYKEAQAIARETLEARRRTLGNDHPDTLMGSAMLGNLLRMDGQLIEAEPSIKEALEGRRRTLGPTNPSTLASMGSLARLYADQGKLSEAESVYGELFEACKDVWPEDSPNRLIHQNVYNYVLLRAGKVEQAEPLIRQCLEVRMRISGPDHPDTLDAMSASARLLVAKGKADEAEPIYRDALERYRRVSGDDNPSTLNAISNLGEALRRRGKLAEAEPLLREALTRCERVYGKDHGRTGASRIDLGRLLLDQQLYANAESELLEAERVLASTASIALDRRMQSLEALRDLYLAWDKAQPGKGHGQSATKWQNSIESFRSNHAKPTTK
jgi:serine/threonine protein kinase/tetratricopeptide (TPR) repeat protein